MVPRGPGPGWGLRHIRAGTTWVAIPGRLRHKVETPCMGLGPVQLQLPHNCAERFPGRLQNADMGPGLLD